MFPETRDFSHGVVHETTHISVKNQLVKAAHANPKTLKVKTYADFDDRDRNCLLYKIEAKYGNDTQDLVKADYVASTKQIVIKSVSKTGRAYMRMIKYIDAHSDQPVNLMKNTRKSPHFNAGMDRVML